MIAKFSSYKFQSVTEPYKQATQGVRTLKQLDGTPGDLNASENAISMETSLGRLDAVVLSNPDNSQTVVQRLTKGNGTATTSWLEIPEKGNGIPNMEGFEVASGSTGYRGVNLEVKESYSNSSFGIPKRTYDVNHMSQLEAQNALMRAESVLAAFPIV